MTPPCERHRPPEDDCPGCLGGPTRGGSVSRRNSAPGPGGVIWLRPPCEPGHQAGVGGGGVALAAWWGGAAPAARRRRAVLRRGQRRRRSPTSNGRLPPAVVGRGNPVAVRPVPLSVSEVSRPCPTVRPERPRPGAGWCLADLSPPAAASRPCRDSASLGTVETIKGGSA